MKQPKSETKRIQLGAAGLLCCLILLAFGSLSIRAQEDLPRATPDAEGVIYVEVQPNDSFWAIAARSGLRLEELLELNGLTENSIMQPGDLLIIGYGTPPATPTSNIPTPTLAPPTLTSTPIVPNTTICLAAFEDINQNSIFDVGETLRPNVAFTVYDETAVVTNYITDGVSEPFCIEGLAAGTYHVTLSVARNEILTTRGDWALTLFEGANLNQAFGSYTGIPSPTPTTFVATVQATAVTIATSTPQPSANNSSTLLTLLLIASGFVLLLSVAVLIFWIVLKEAPTHK